MKRTSFSIGWITLLALLSLFVYIGCKGDTGPAGPAGTNPALPPVITSVIALPDSVGTGEYTTVIVSAYDPNGDAITYAWTATYGTFGTPDAAYSRWTPPDSIGLYTINVAVTDADGTTNGTVLVGVNTYVPAVTPSYLGNNAVACGHCHNGKLGGWYTTPHFTAFDSSDFSLEDRTTGYDTAVDNGGYDDNPVDALKNVQCEACHGPQGPDVGDHRHLSAGARSGESCGQCHAQWAEYQYSGHGTAMERAGGQEEFMAEWGRSSCQGCHISEGFIMLWDEDWTGRALPHDGNQVACGTCHDPHASSSDNPEQIRTTEDFTLLYGGEDNPDAYTVTGWGMGQLCGQCHHSRTNRTSLMNAINNGAQRAYPHYSPQADMIAGHGSYEIPSMTYERDNQHLGEFGEGEPLENVCVSCHMRDVETPYEHAEHSFYPNVQNCYGCHGTPTNFDIDGKQTEIQNLLDELGQMLPSTQDEFGHYIVSGDTRDTTNVWTTREMREAAWAWQFVYRDASKGVHNYTYAHSLLTNAIDYLTP